jgi:hypothetical protein
MAEPALPVILVGAGRRASATGAALSGLARSLCGLAQAGGGESGTGADACAAPSAPLPEALPASVEDLEQLLQARTQQGLLLLEAARVPAEDVGFVRRFLERNPHWSLVLLGDDQSEATARRLTALPRASWLAWPPDLEQLLGLLARRSAPIEERRAAPTPASLQTPARARMADVATLGQESGASGALDVAALVEELLTGQTVARGGLRTTLQKSGRATTQIARTRLTEALGGLLALARRCTGSTGVLAARVAGASGTRAARIEFEFPLGPLTDGDLPDLLLEPFEGDADLAADVALASAGASELESLGGSVELAPEGPGRLRLTVGLPAAAGVQAAPAETQRARARTRPEGRASAADPFA